MAHTMNTLPDDLLFDHDCDDFWVFAYGSLMWRPDFEFSDRQLAVLKGYSRALCVYSWVHRGTKEKPGLVFGLDEGGRCEGVLYNIPVHARREAVEMLRARELVTNVYQEMVAPVHVVDGAAGPVRALFYTVVRDHEQYADMLGRDDIVRLVRQGVGQSGVNLDYVMNTHAHLTELGIRDTTLAAICADLEAPVSAQD